MSEHSAHAASSAAQACRRASAGAILFAAMAASCLYEEGDRCGPNMAVSKEFCVCAQGTTLVAGQCTVVETPPPPPSTGAGTPCDPAVATSCPDPLYPSCQTAINGEHYCTALGCTQSSDCPPNYQCQSNGATSFCRRPYSGQGATCTANETCSAFDASACATLIMKCVVPNCPNVPCDPDHTCFDASTLSPGAPKLCIETSILQR
jgi:hypothetical protein